MNVFILTADLENMTSAERITILQEKLQEIRKHYLSLKSEVASIDRRRKRLKKKERESKFFVFFFNLFFSMNQFITL
jgi:molecular chaperone GrpE (heat shock protein)